jgi:hypothetical protein
MNIIIIIFQFVAKIFKISSINLKLTELLFENLKEKRSYLKINKYDLNFDKQSNSNQNNFQNNNKNIILNNNINDFSSVQLFPQDQGKKILCHNNNDKNHNKSNDGKNAINQKVSNDSKGKEINRSVDGNLMIEENKSANNSNRNYNNNLYFRNNNISSNLLFKNINYKNDDNSQNYNETNNIIKTKTQYLRKQLFPYKYYLCSIFIKNTDIKKNCFFTKKFIVVYDFICQLFDISSYLILQREFQTMKNTIIEEKERKIIEKEQKINVNERFFNMNMKECLNGKKLSIFGKTQLQKSAKNMRNKLVI